MSNDSKRGHRAHALSHQACPYVLGISRLVPPCAVAIRIAHFSNLRELDVYLSALLHPPAKLPLWLGGNKKILAKSCAFERKNLQIVHKIKRKFNAVSSCCERGKLFLTLLRSLKKGFSCKVVGGELDGAWRGEAGDRVHILTFSMAERVHDKDSNPFGH